MKKLIKITERDITNIVKKIIREMEEKEPNKGEISDEELKKMWEKKSNKITMASLMQKSDLGDASDASDRSLFRKKLFKEKNEDGSVHKFTNKEKHAIINVLKSL